MAALTCGNVACGKALAPPLLQCSKCKGEAYCCKECQVVAWKKGHKHKCGAPGKGKAVATKLRHAVRAAVHAEAMRAPGGLNSDQNTLRTRLEELQEARDWLGVVAIEQEAVGLARELRGTNLGLAGRIHSTLGNAFHATGDYLRSRQEHEKHRAVCEVLGDREGVAAACCNLGLCYYSTGDYARSRELHEQHKVICEELGDRAGVAGACGNLGNCYQSMGDYARARELHQQRMAMAGAMGDTVGMARACNNIANCYLCMGDYAQARELHEQQRAIWEELGDRGRVAMACANIGVCCGSIGEYVQARAMHERHREISEELGDRAGVGAACGNLGSCYLSSADYGSAISHFMLQYNMAKEMLVKADQGMGALGVGIALRLQVRAKVRGCAGGDAELPGHPPPALVRFDDEVLNAERWLQTALSLGRSAACLHLACLEFDANKEACAVEYLQFYLTSYVKLARKQCAGCEQMRGEDAQMLTCGGCRVARFCSADHQKMASKSVALGGSLLQGRHKDVCGVLGKWRRQVVKDGMSPDVLRADLLAFLSK